MGLMRFPPIGGHAIHPAHRLIGGQTPLNRIGILIARPENTRRRIERLTRTGVFDMDATTAFIGTVAAARIAWMSKARCCSSDPDELFVRGAAQKKAAVICEHCPVVVECLADALDNQTEFGVWGGMTERQRRALLKQHPEVVSWSEFFAAQRKHRNTDEPA
jgi:WhiB family transcriptional regulator, redox-sensing transcriptional regulator